VIKAMRLAALTTLALLVSHCGSNSNPTPATKTAKTAKSAILPDPLHPFTCMDERTQHISISPDHRLDIFSECLQEYLGDDALLLE